MTRALRIFRRSPTAVFGLVILLGMLLMGLLAPLLSPKSPTRQDIMSALAPPVWSAKGTWDHPLGTDHLGRDVWSRVAHGARISILVAFSATVVSALIGVLLGVIAGYFGGAVEHVILRVADLQLAFPMILLALALVAILGPSLGNLILVMGVTGWMMYTRVVRALVLSLREREFVIAARAIGAGDWLILFRHIIPNVMNASLVMLTLELARMILMESSLSFLGLGVPPPTPTWGRMLSESRTYMTTAYWMITFPGIAISLTVLGMNLFGDGMRDALDPKMSRFAGKLQERQ
jgi:peptide/nickel transport system permease protein